MTNFYLAQLQQFVAKARANTWAGNLGKSESKRLGSKGTFVFEEGNLRYEDEYFGGDRFQGEEVVYQDSVPVWGMVYFGGVPIGANVNAEEEFEFLKMALVAKSETARISGYTDFTYDKRAYVCDIVGDLEDFTGTEKVMYDDLLTHEVFFAGGVIQK